MFVKYVDTVIGELGVQYEADKIFSIFSIEIHKNRIGYEPKKLKDLGSVYLNGEVDSFIENLKYYVSGEFDALEQYKAVIGSSGFRLKVLKAMSEISWGNSVSYKQLALNAGSSNAYRAAGTVCKTNVLPFVIPCHRATGISQAGVFLGAMAGPIIFGAVDSNISTNVAWTVNFMFAILAAVTIAFGKKRLYKSTVN